MLITLGNQPAGEDGAAIYDLQADGTLTYEVSLDEQGNHNTPVLMATGKLVIGGADPSFGDGWDYGNVYVKSSGTWQKKRTLENVIHVFGQTIHNGLLYVGTGSHTGDNSTFEGRVFWSPDIGDTWQSSYVCFWRVRDLISFSGDLYAVCDEWNSRKLCKSTDDGLTWGVVDGVTPSKDFRMVIWQNTLVITKSTGSALHLVGTNGDVSQISLPAWMTPPGNCCNHMAVIADDLYILAGSLPSLVYRYDGSDWHYHCDLGERCCSLLNFENQFLIASTLGVDAKILKIPLN